MSTAAEAAAAAGPSAKAITSNVSKQRTGAVAEAGARSRRERREQRVQESEAHEREDIRWAAGGQGEVWARHSHGF